MIGSEMVVSLLDPESDKAALASAMHEAENAADDTTHEIIKLVNSTFITPFDREDIYALASSLDDVMDFMEEAVDSTVLYGVTEFPEVFAAQVDVLQRACKLTAEAMPRLRTRPEAW